MPTGRPTKYNSKVREIAEAYIENYESEHEHAIPSIVGLANILKVQRQTIYNWGDDNEEFLDILEEINQKQEIILITKGLKSEFNSNITKLALGKHGYHDKIDNQSTMNVTITEKDAGLLE